MQSYILSEAIQYLKQVASDNIKNQVVECTNNAIANLGTGSVSINGANAEPTRIITDFNKKILYCKVIRLEQELKGIGEKSKELWKLYNKPRIHNS